MARPKLDINEAQVEQLAAINCSVAEIAAVIGCHKRTLERNFAAVIEKGRERGTSSLKKKMYELAMGGNITMCIWLSKQMMGYTDKVETTTEIKAVAEEVKRIKSLSPEERAKELADGKQAAVMTPVTPIPPAQGPVQ